MCINKELKLIENDKFYEKDVFKKKFSSLWKKYELHKGYILFKISNKTFFFREGYHTIALREKSF